MKDKKNVEAVLATVTKNYIYKSLKYIKSQDNTLNIIKTINNEYGNKLY